MDLILTVAIAEHRLIHPRSAAGHGADARHDRLQVTCLSDDAMRSSLHDPKRLGLVDRNAPQDHGWRKLTVAQIVDPVHHGLKPERLVDQYQIGLDASDYFHTSHQGTR